MFWDKLTKAKYYPAIAIGLITFGSLSALWLLSASLWFRGGQPSQGLSELTPVEDKIATDSMPPAIAAPDSSPAPVPAPTPQTVQSRERLEPGTRAVNRQGKLRISNPTEYPVRIALLAKLPATSGKAAAGYEPPAHWDFAPQEGGTKGLLVGLPSRNLKVKKGDILVAFAQDGSRRYWGPYVVGETSVPAWNPKAAEWQLTLEP